MEEVYLIYTHSILTYLMMILLEHSWTHVKEIPNTKLLVSLHHRWNELAGMAIFDISKKQKAKEIFAFPEVRGSKIDFLLVYNYIIGFLGTGDGDVSYNSRRGILSAIPVRGSIACHIFNIGYSGQKNNNYEIKLLKKAKWNSRNNIRSRTR